MSENETVPPTASIGEEPTETTGWLDQFDELPPWCVPVRIYWPEADE